MLELVPVEFNLAGVYMPPLLIASAIALLLARYTARFMNRKRLSQYFFYPPLVFVALTLIYSLTLETLISAL